MWHIKQAARFAERGCRDLKPDSLSPQRSEMKNLSAYHQEDFLRNLKLTLMLILVPLLRELWPFWGGHPVCNMYSIQTRQSILGSVSPTK